MTILSPTSKQLTHAVNPYHWLQVRHDATPLEIRDNYRKLALWHHPGRAKSLTIDDEEEVQRRAQVFEILAACYETLIDYQNAYNICLHTMEHRPLKGEIHVGGKQMMVYGSLDEDYEVVPTMMKASSDESDDKDEQEKDTRLMYEGPLEALYRARHYQPFSDPYDVFERVCGHAVFARPSNYRHNKCIVLNELATAPSPPVVCTGSTVKKRNGTVISCTSRTAHNWKVTRTETSSTDSRGRTHVHIEVTSDHVPAEYEDASVSQTSCCHSAAEDAVMEEMSLCSWSDMTAPYSWLFPSE